MARVGRGQKYHARPTAGFASAGEHNRYQHLRLQERAGVIRDLHVQQTVVLVPGITLRVDFVYVDVPSDQQIWEDYKGMETPIFRLKARLWKLVGPGLLRIPSRHGVREVISEHRTLSEPAA